MRHAQLLEAFHVIFSKQSRFQISKSGNRRICHWWNSGSCRASRGSHGIVRLVLVLRCQGSHMVKHAQHAVRLLRPVALLAIGILTAIGIDHLCRARLGSKAFGTAPRVRRASRVVVRGEASYCVDQRAHEWRDNLLANQVQHQRAGHSARRRYVGRPLGRHRSYAGTEPLLARMVHLRPIPAARLLCLCRLLSPGTPVYLCLPRSDSALIRASLRLEVSRRVFGGGEGAHLRLRACLPAAHCFRPLGRLFLLLGRLFLV